MRLSNDNSGFNPETATEGKARGKVMEVLKTLGHVNASDDEVAYIGRLLVDNAQDKTDYVKCVLFPDKCDPARYPTQFPIPTGLIKNKDTFNVKTNSSGNAAVMFNPSASFYASVPTYLNADCYAVLYNGPLLNFGTATQFGGTSSGPLVADNAIGSTGETFESKRFKFNANSQMHAAVSRVRVVAFGIKANYTWNEQNMSGTMESCSLPDELGATVTLPTEGEVEDQMFHHVETDPRKGIRHISFPIDADAQRFQTNDPVTGTTSIGTNVSAIALLFKGFPSNVQCIRITVTRVLEYIPTASMRELITPVMQKATTEGVIQIARVIENNRNAVSSSLEDEMEERIMKPDGKSHWMDKFGWIWNLGKTVAGYVHPGVAAVMQGAETAKNMLMDGPNEPLKKKTIKKKRANYDDDYFEREPTKNEMIANEFE
jgi:hypothetical protein